MIELELIEYDRFAATYRIKSRNSRDICVYGSARGSDDYSFSFPIINFTKSRKIDTNYILYNHLIFTSRGQGLKEFFNKTARKELELEINTLLRNRDEKELLLHMLFKGALALRGE